MLNGVNEIIQSLENYQKNDNIRIKEEKFKDNRHKLAYLYSIYKDPEINFNCNTQNEIISSFYNNLLEEKNDEKIIETILLTSLDQFGKSYP